MMVRVPVQEKKFRCTSKRLFLWNEKLMRNQISESEALCVIIRRRKYRRRERCDCLSCYASWCGYDDICCSTVIPFDLSRLLNKDPSLFSMLLCATLQFPPKDIKQMANQISSYFFTKFPFSPPPRPPYVIALEISQFIIVDHASHYVWIPWKPPPPPMPSFCRFDKDLDLVEEIRTCARSVSITDYMSDHYNEYPGDVLEYIYALREYTGEGGMCPTKPPIAVDVPNGLEEVKTSSSTTPIDHQLNDDSKDLMDDTCPVCYADFKDRNEVITTNCLHEFHIQCLLTWLSKKNTCPTCRAVCPLLYRPFPTAVNVPSTTYWSLTVNVKILEPSI